MKDDKVSEWQIFESTGAIDHYLQFKHSMQTDVPEEEDDADDNNGPRFEGYKDGGI